MHRVVDLIETLDCEKPFMNFVNLDGSFQYLVEVEVSDFAPSRKHICAFAMGADDAAAIHFDLSSLPNQSKFDRIPKQPAQPFEHRRIVHSCADAAIVLKEIRDD